MNTDYSTKLIDHALSEKVIGAYYTVYNEFGPGFLESVYENALMIALGEADVQATQQASIQVTFHGHTVGEFRADILVDDRIIVELKTASSLTSVHEAQLINYLKATGIRVGLLFNFGAQPEFRRRVY